MPLPYFIECYIDFFLAFDVLVRESPTAGRLMPEMVFECDAVVSPCCHAIRGLSAGGVVTEQ